MAAVPETCSGPPSVATIVRKLEAAPSRPLAPVSPPSGTREPSHASRTVSAAALTSVLPPTSSCPPPGSNRIVPAAVEAVEAAERATSDACSLTSASSVYRAPAFEVPRSACSSTSLSCSGEAASFDSSIDRSPRIKSLTPAAPSPPKRKHGQMTTSESALANRPSQLEENFPPSHVSVAAGCSSATTASSDSSKRLQENSSRLVQGTACGEEDKAVIAAMMATSLNTSAKPSLSEAGSPPSSPHLNLHESAPMAAEGGCSASSSRRSLAASTSATDVAEEAAKLHISFAEKAKGPLLTEMSSLTAATLSSSSGEQDVTETMTPSAGAEDSSRIDSYSLGLSTPSFSLDPDARESVAAEAGGNASHRSFADSVRVSGNSAAVQASTELAPPGSLCDSESSNLEHVVSGKRADVASVPTTLSPCEISPVTPAAAAVAPHPLATHVESNAPSRRLSFEPSTNGRQSVQRGRVPVSVSRSSGIAAVEGNAGTPRRTVSNMHTRPLKDAAKRHVPRRSSGVTVPKPFHFAGEKFHRAGQKEIERQRMEAERATRMPRKFRARPMPDFTLDPRAALR